MNTGTTYEIQCNQRATFIIRQERFPSNVFRIRGRKACVCFTPELFELERGPAYFECHNLDWAGHGQVKHCEIQRTSLEIDLKNLPNTLRSLSMNRKKKLATW